MALIVGTVATVALGVYPRFLATYRSVTFALDASIISTVVFAVMLLVVTSISRTREKD
jgi:hypothetical protein